jgi:integrase
MAIEVLTKRLNDRTVLLEKYPRLGNIEYVFVQDDCQHMGQPMSTWAVTNEMWKRSIRLYNQNLMHHAKKDNRSVDRAKLIPEGALVFHTLRHSFATWLNEAGTDLDDIAMVGGWKSLDACTRDVKNSQDRAREVGARIDNFF